MKQMDSEVKICVLICYFGEWPWYFDYFIHSCKFNLTIDFVIITDNVYEKQMSANVTIINKTLEEVRLMASKKLGLNVCIDNAYKLCDLKPAYGLIFSELLSGYDFWAQSDIDIIYGDIRAFMNDEILSSYDFISVRHDYTTGCFALYKNNSLINNLFKNSADYVKIFTSSEHFCFDECNHVHPLLEDGSKTIFEVETQIESFTHVIKAAELEGQIKAHFDFIIIEGLPGQLKFVNGKIIYKNIYEALLYHLIIFKQVYKPLNKLNMIPNTYRISPSRIYF